MYTLLCHSQWLPKQEEIRFFLSMLQGTYRVDDLSTILLLENKIRKHLHWFDKEPAGVQRITTVHKQKSRYSSRILPAEFMNMGLLHAAMIKPYSAPELSHLWGSTVLCFTPCKYLHQWLTSLEGVLPFKFTRVFLMLHGAVIYLSIYLICLLTNL